MKISVITVCYNSAATIADTVRSVAAQTWKDIEYIIIDGASSDNTLEVVRKYDTRNARIISEPDKGIYDAMNKGIRHATGDVIGFLNADDMYASPDALSLIAGAFTDPAVQATYGNLCYVQRDNLSSVVRYWRSQPFHPKIFRKGWCPAHPTFYVRREVYEKFGGYDTGFKIASDVDLMMRFLEVHKIHARQINRVLVKMRMGGTTNKSLSNIVKQNREVWRALKEHGLEPFLPSFIVSKLLSRGLQFLTSPPSELP